MDQDKKPRSRFLTKPLDLTEKRLLAKSLGLSDLRFSIVHFFRGKVIRVLRVEGFEVEIDLNTSSFARADEPVLVFEHTNNPIELEFELGTSLLSALLPEPLNYLAYVASQRHTKHLRLLPAGFAKEVHDLYAAFELFQKRTSLFEFTCLYVRGSQESFPLLIQCVKGARVGLARLVQGESLADRLENQTLNETAVFNYFGSTAACYLLDNSSWNVANETSPLSGLASRTVGLLEASAVRVLARDPRREEDALLGL